MPIDYYGEIYCTTSILFMKHLRNKYEIVKMADKAITVNGKNRFYRVLVKRKKKDTKEQKMKKAAK